MTQRSPAQTYAYLKKIIGNNVKGRDLDTENHTLSTIDLLLTTLFIQSHILIEDYPGSGKTFLAKVVSDAIDFTESQSPFMTGFNRVQCMVDLLPTDITGTEVKDRDEWVIKYGPIFSHIFLVDEINRTTPKVQAAFLEAMAEKQITILKEVKRLEPIFFLIATQNPFDRVGTFELPYAQLDRFLFKRNLSPIMGESLRAIIRMNYEESQIQASLAPVPLQELLNAMSILNQPLTERAIEDDLIALHTHFTRRVCIHGITSPERVISPQCSLSPRTLRLLKAAVDFRLNLSRSSTGSETLPYHTEEHLLPLLPDLLRHRILLEDLPNHEEEIQKVIQEIRQDVLEESIQSQRRSRK